MKLLNNIHYYFSELVWLAKSRLTGQRYWTPAETENLPEGDYGVIISKEDWFKKYSISKDE